MYCMAIVTGINCVLNELNIWTDISSEHPIFLKTVAELTNKKLTKEMISALNEINIKFAELNKKVKNINKQHYGFPNYVMPSLKMKTVDLCKKFQKLDRKAIRFYDELQDIDEYDKIWQALLAHIIHEQKYMYKLFDKLLEQME